MLMEHWKIKCINFFNNDLAVIIILTLNVVTKWCADFVLKCIDCILSEKIRILIMCKIGFHWPFKNSVLQVSKGTLYKVSIKSNTNAWGLLGFHKGKEDLAQPLLNTFSSWCLTLRKKRIHISLSCLTVKALQRYYHESYIYFFQSHHIWVLLFQGTGKMGINSMHLHLRYSIHKNGLTADKAHAGKKRVIRFKRRVRTKKKESCQKKINSYIRQESQTEGRTFRVFLLSYSWRAA